jgi:hypothetical protein
MATGVIKFDSIMTELGGFFCSCRRSFDEEPETSKRLTNTQSTQLISSQANKDSTPDIKIIYEIIIKKMTGMAENSVYKFKAPKGLSFAGKFRLEYKKLCRLCLDKNLYLISSSETQIISIYLLKCPETLQDVINNIDYLGKANCYLKGNVHYKIGTDMDHNALYKSVKNCDKKSSKITALKRTHDNTVKVYY